MFKIQNFLSIGIQFLIPLYVTYHRTSLKYVCNQHTCVFYVLI